MYRFIRQSRLSLTILQKFDRLLLLQDGRQVYFGLGSMAVTYFTRLGFIKPEHMTTADFLTSLSSPNQCLIRKGYENRVPRSPDEFASVWKHSQEERALLNEIATFNATTPIAPVTGSSHKLSPQRSESIIPRQVFTSAVRISFYS